ncbi:MAG: TRAP transporter small permease [Thermodesulfobacteriota bacterium]
MIAKLYERVALLGRGFNVLAAIAVVLMMLLTCADVLLRSFRRPIPGTYEIMGFLGTVVIAFALASTSVEKGHIAVELLVARLPRKFRTAVAALASFVGAGLFALICWQSVAYAADLRSSGEVSVTLTLPVYPFIYGIAAGSGLLCLLLSIEGLLSAMRMTKQ